MFIGIHRNTPYRRTNTKPSLSSSFPVFDMLVSFIAHDSDCSTHIAVEFPDFATGEFADCPFAGLLHDSGV